MSRPRKPLSYSDLDLTRCDVYRLRFQVQEWACIAELFEDAPHGVDETAKEVVGTWARHVSAAYDLTPRRKVTLEITPQWADFTWYVLTLPSAGDLEDIGRSLREQVLRQNRDARARARSRGWSVPRSVR